jgi:hypothetical protein
VALDLSKYKVENLENIYVLLAINFYDDKIKIDNKFKDK